MPGALAGRFLSRAGAALTRLAAPLTGIAAAIRIGERSRSPRGTDG